MLSRDSLSSRLLPLVSAKDFDEAAERTLVAMLTAAEEHLQAFETVRLLSVETRQVAGRFCVRF